MFVILKARHGRPFSPYNHASIPREKKGGACAVTAGVIATHGLERVLNLDFTEGRLREGGVVGIRLAFF